MKRIAKTFVSFILAFLICNLICRAYIHLPGYLERTSAGTDGIYYPNSYILYGREGYGYANVDCRGYMNPNLPLEDEYILVMGSSNVNGINVFQGNRFVDLLNKRLHKSPNSLKLYNVAQDGFCLTDVVKGFPAFLSEFPNSSQVIIEVGTLNFNEAQLKDALKQKHFDPEMAGNNIVKHISFKDHFKHFVKDNFTITSQANKQWLSLKENQGGFLKDTTPTQIHGSLDFKEANLQAYYDTMISLIRSEYDKKIIVIYIPSVKILESGNLKIIEDAQFKYLEKACTDNNITIINPSRSFIDYYNHYHVLPSGFLNTQPGKGHLNKTGHKIIAELLYDALTEKN